MEWLRNYFKNEEKPKVSVQEEYDKLFTSFWLIHGDTIKKLYEGLNDCLELKSYRLLFTHENIRHAAEVHICTVNYKPSVRISLYMHFLAFEGMYDDLDLYPKVDKMESIKNSLSSYGKIKSKYVDNTYELYDFTLRLRAKKDNKFLTLVLYCGDPDVWE